MIYPLFEELIKTKLSVLPRVHFDAQIDMVLERNSNTLDRVSSNSSNHFHEAVCKPEERQTIVDFPRLVLEVP